jgi:hypothetical protein
MGIGEWVRVKKPVWFNVLKGHGENLKTSYSTQTGILTLTLNPWFIGG